MQFTIHLHSALWTVLLLSHPGLEAGLAVGVALRAAVRLDEHPIANPAH